MAVRRMANQVAGYVALVLVVAGGYFGYVFIPPYMDNYELKSLAKTFILSARQPQDEERSLAAFLREAGFLYIKLDDSNFRYERNYENTKAKVSVNYARDVRFPLTKKVRTLRFKWAVEVAY